MGVAATGIYGAAAKFLEFIELPLRSFGAVNFNNLAKMANAGKHQESFSYAMQRIRSTTIRIIPIALLLWMFSPQLISFLSGPNYAGSVPVLRVMAIYCILIPADRYFGLLLEAFGRPDLNLIKVLVMLLTNVAGNLIAIFFFGSLVSVAVSSIITFSIGIGFGLWLVMAKAMPRATEINLKMAVSHP
jgi:O-antigen/teichoic acid export membrane protein